VVQRRWWSKEHLPNPLCSTHLSTIVYLGANDRLPIIWVYSRGRQTLEEGIESGLLRTVALSPRTTFTWQPDGLYFSFWVPMFDLISNITCSRMSPGIARLGRMAATFVKK
jgi:hypothetical protein